MTRTKIWLILFVFLVNLAGGFQAPGQGTEGFHTGLIVNHGPSTAHAASPEPDTLQGKVTYRARGPIVYGSGIAAGFLLGLLGYFEMMQYDQTLTEIGDLIDKLINKQIETGSEPASEGDIEGGPMDLAEIGFIGYHEITIEFVLEEKTATTFELQSGLIEWRGASEGAFALAWDSFFDSGFQALDPARDRISLEIKPDSMEYELDISVSHPYTVNGKSDFILPLYPPPLALNLFVEADHGNVTAGVLFGSYTDRKAVDGLPEEYTLNHLVRAPYALGDSGAHLETFGALFGTHIVVETILHPRCEVVITSPEPDAVLTYNPGDPGELHFVAIASSGTFRSDSLDELVWTFPEIEGSTLTTDPEDRRGPRVEVTYIGLPADNSQFGEKEITARFEMETLCDDPPPQKVRVFFSRDATNNPDGTVPNWFYYWKQTSAAQGLEGHIRYCGIADDAYGYYGWWQEPFSAGAMEFFITDLVTGGATNPLQPTFSTIGIDTFATTVAHEYQHLQDYHEWWGPLYDSERVAEWRITCGNEFDLDGDRVPCTVEPSLGLDPENPFSYGNALFGAPMPDAEVTAYWAELAWSIGSANHEDWANPGKQSGGGN